MPFLTKPNVAVRYQRLCQSSIFVPSFRAADMSQEVPSTEAMAIFAVGHYQSSRSFLNILAEDETDEITMVFALRQLSRMWHQYRMDRGINHGRTLLSMDNSFEVRVFSRLISELTEWQPLRKANSIVMGLSPALSPDERRIHDSDLSESLDVVQELTDILMRSPTDLLPFDALGQLIDKCLKLEEKHERGACWALNLGCALRADRLGLGDRSTPFPALLRREMFRFDRSKVWRRQALISAIAQSGHDSSQIIFDLYRSLSAFKFEFLSLRRHSRLRSAFSYLSGFGELNPTMLARILGCSEPGARKMLALLCGSGFAVRKTPSPAFSVATKFRSAWPKAAWLRSRGYEAAHDAGDPFSFED